MPHQTPTPVNFDEKSARRCRGFTLVELLVVIGIIATLIAMLMPALAAARQAALTTRCLSNLHQMVVAVNIYAGTNQGSYPPAYWFYTSGSTSIETDWDYTTTTTSGGTTSTPGLLWSDQGDLQVQQCPAFDGKANAVGNSYTGYNYNTSTIGHGQLETIPAPVKMTDVTGAADCALFGDGQYAAGANKFMRSPQPADDTGFWSRTAGTQGYRHQKRTNVAYCDGHAETVAAQHTASSAGTAALGTGFLSSDNRAYLRSQP